MNYIEGSMPEIDSSILSLNAGSSSIKFALYHARDPLQRRLQGKLERIGLGGTKLYFEDAARQRASVDVAAATLPAAATCLIDWLEARSEVSSLVAVGHRVVHGMQHVQPELVSPELLAELRRIEPYAPDHLAGEIELMEAFRRRHPQLRQVACFDTAFHARLPRVAQVLPIPRRYEARGLRRYGFHGLSYAYLLQELERLGGARVAKGRVILAHLGSGASLAAVLDGRSLDTTMAFTPAAGLLMGTRSGDLDPGLVLFLARSEQLTASEFDQMVNHESGLRGISETSSDMKDLLAREHEDVRAAEAVAAFCYQAKKGIGAYAAVLGGLDTLVFAGGIGENSPQVRARICEGLGFLGIELSEARNGENAPVISLDARRVTVRVIQTDEELMLARLVCRTLDLNLSMEGGA